MARKRILFIDGDEPFVQDVANAARRRGYETIITASSTDGCELARSEHPDLIVVSVELTPTNGWSVCTKLKKDEELRGVPVVLTSSTSTPDTFEKHKKLKTRADDYLLKPYSGDDLIRVATQLLGAEEPVEDDLVVQDETLGGADFEVGGMEEIHVEGDEPLLNGHGEQDQQALDPLAGGDEVYASEALPELTSESLQDEGSLGHGGSDDLAAFDRSFEHISHAGAEQEQEARVDDELTADLGVDGHGLDAPLAPPSRPPPHPELSEDAPEAYEPARVDDSGEEAPIFGGESTSEEEAALATFDLNAARLAGEELAHTSGVLESPVEGESAFPAAEGAFPESALEAPLDSATAPLATPEHPEMTGDPTFYADAAALQAGSGELPYDPSLYEEPGRVSELEARVAELEAEVEGYRATEGSRDQDLERLREDGRRKDRESQDLRDQLHEKERAFREMKEAESRAAVEAAKSRDERVRREAAMKALTARAEQMSAQAKRLERDALAAREELKAAMVFKTRLAELEQSSKQAQAAASTELASVQAQHAAALEQQEAIRQEKETALQQLATLRQEHDTLRTQADTLRSEGDALRSQHEAAVQQHDTLRQQHDSLRQQHDSLVQDHDVLGQQQQQTEQERDTARQQHDQVRQELELVKAAHGQAVIDLEAARGDHDAARTELDELRHVVDRHIGTISDLEQKLSSTEEEKESLASKARAAGDRAGRTRDTLLKLVEELALPH